MIYNGIVPEQPYCPVPSLFQFLHSLPSFLLSSPAELLLKNTSILAFGNLFIHQLQVPNFDNSSVSTNPYPHHG